MPFTAAQIAERLGGEVLGDGSVQLLGLATAEHARAGDLTFAENAAYFAAAEQSPSATIAASAQIDATAHIGPSCVDGPGVQLGARSVLMGGNHIGRDCQIGDD